MSVYSLTLSATVPYKLDRMMTIRQSENGQVTKFAVKSLRKRNESTTEK